MKPLNIVLTIFALLFISSVRAQDKEIGVFIGTTQYQGDLSKKQVTISETKPSVGILVRHYFSPRLNFKGGLYLGWIEGDDNNYDNVDRDRMKRNLSFRSHVAELSGQMELNILPFISSSRRYRFAPYVFAGLALYHFNPTAEMDGKRYALQPLGTEGQTINDGQRKYSRLQGAIPYGFGFKYSLGNYWNIALEVGQRKLFTDYLDDVSKTYPDYDQLYQQNPTAARLSDRSRELGDPKLNFNKGGQKRGDSKDMDMYLFAGFTITKTIRRFSCTGL